MFCSCKNPKAIFPIESLPLKKDHINCDHLFFVMVAIRSNDLLAQEFHQHFQLFQQINTDLDSIAETMEFLNGGRNNSPLDDEVSFY